MFGKARQQGELNNFVMEIKYETQHRETNKNMKDSLSVI